MKFNIFPPTLNSNITFRNNDAPYGNNNASYAVRMTIDILYEGQIRTIEASEIEAKYLDVFTAPSGLPYE